MRDILLLLGFTTLLGLPLLVGLFLAFRRRVSDSSQDPVTFFRRLYADPLLFAVQVAPALLVFAYALSLLLVSRPASGYNSFWEGWVCNVAELSPLIPITLRIYRSPRVRYAWIFLGLGVLLYNVGNLVYTLHDQNLVPIPSPAPSDVFYLSSYLAIGIGIILFTVSSSVAAARVRLDGVITGLAFAALAALFWFGPVLHAASGSTLEVAVNMSYPVCDLTLLVLLVASLAPAHYHLNLPTSLLMSGITAFVIGDIIYMNQVASNTYVQGHLLDITWPLGIWMIGLAAFPHPDQRAHTRVPHHHAIGVNLVPIFSASICVAVIAASLLISATPVCILLALAGLSLVVVRMALTLREIRVLGVSSFTDARTDDVTGLANRRRFLEAGPLLLDETAPDQCFGVLLVDLDGFKEINDSIGHAAGDHLLEIVGQRFTSRTDSYGTVARLGGDEFAIPVTASSSAELMSLARDLVDSLDDPLSLDGLFVRVAASVGVAWYPTHGASFTELLRCADIAMYTAKQAHLGVAAYDSGADMYSRQRLALTADLRNAIDSSSLALHYQPILNLSTGLPCGIEALVRWPHSREGLLYPDVIIPLAEASALIVPLTRTVLNLAIAEAARLNLAGRGLTLNVNITNYDLVDEHFADLVADLLATHSVAPTTLTLEVTESALSQNQAATRRCAEQLRTMGVRLSIDDFGVGYSSLSEMLTLDVDEIKIDKSFVDGLDTDPRARPLIAAVIEIGRAFNLEVVAEGIEDQRILAALTAMGVASAQGYVISKPLDPIALERYLNHAFTDVVVSSTLALPRT